jgi:hypothetical protein
MSEQECLQSCGVRGIHSSILSGGDSYEPDPILKGLLLIVALLLGLNLAVSLPAVPSTQAAGTFQYKTVDYRIEGGEQTTPMDHIQEVLNQQGQEG